MVILRGDCIASSFMLFIDALELGAIVDYAVGGLEASTDILLAKLALTASSFLRISSASFMPLSCSRLRSQAFFLQPILIMLPPFLPPLRNFSVWTLTATNLLKARLMNSLAAQTSPTSRGSENSLRNSDQVSSQRLTQCWNECPCTICLEWLSHRNEAGLPRRILLSGSLPTKG